ncbi:unnamed protein product [Allacma fusca]|uniref:C2H2-type domain-containing protein n=1 Tax=Allacma fusca TaxID=39272 RepID=A0A8J2K6W6_9HEXA|nr:unnamed protein product [Allacma fusca]
MDCGADEFAEIKTIDVEGSPVCVVTDPVGNVISITILPDQNSDYQFEVLQDEVGPGKETALIDAKCDELCLLCAKIVTAEISSQGNVDLLKLLCQTMNFPTIEPILTQMNLPVSNSQFCGDCSKAILDSADILIQMKSLDENLKQLRHQLKKSITNCTKEASTGPGSGQMQAGPFVRKLFGQCWSECSVDLVRVHHGMHPVTVAESSIPRKRKRKIKAWEDKLANEILKDEGSSNGENNLGRSDCKKTEGIELIKKRQHRPRQNTGNDKLAEGFSQEEDSTKYNWAENKDVLTIPPVSRGKRQCKTKVQNTKSKSEVKSEASTCENERIVKQETSVQDPRAVLTEPRPVKIKRERKVHPLVNAFLKGITEKEEQNTQPDDTFEDTDLFETNDGFEETETQEESNSIEVTVPRNFSMPISRHTLESCRFRPASNSVTSSETNGLTWSEEKKRRDHMKTCPQNPRIKYKDMPINSKLPCDQCDKTFVTIHALRSHLVSIHYKIYKFYCEICAAGFLIMSDLKRHIEFVHTNEKKYHCDQCDYKFKTPRQLIYHRRRHTGQIPFTCEICGKGFITSDKLKVHLTVHSKERQCPCPHCGKLFKSKHNVYNHVYTTHIKARKNRPKKDPAVSSSDSKPTSELDPLTIESKSDSGSQSIVLDPSVLYITC